MPFRGQQGKQYTRAQVQDELGVPNDRRGGDWTTGYTQYEGEFFVFCNIGVPGRTGHDYNNNWEGDNLIWYGKSGTTLTQPQIIKLKSGDSPVHIFYRSEDRTPFTYRGLGRVVRVNAKTPVEIEWAFSEPPINPEITAGLVRHGFELGVAGVKTQEAIKGDLRVYVKRETKSFPLVIRPEWEQRITDLKLAGGLRPESRVYYHNSTMRSFPQRLHDGDGKIPYGLDFQFADQKSLDGFLNVLTSTADQLELPSSVDQPNIDPITETEVTRAARLGQQQFRSDLIERFKGRCALTEVDMLETLRASHIKPWSKSTNKERRDPDNGILLGVHLDCLFDKGLISFSEDGNVLVSSRVSSTVRRAFGLDALTHLSHLQPGTRAYLKYHRTELFVP